MLLFWLVIYILVGVMIADNGKNLRKSFKSLKSFLVATLIIIFWPFVLGVIFIEVVDEIKRNRGM